MRRVARRPHRRLRAAAMAAVALALVAGGRDARAEDPVVVYAAASLTNAVTEIAAACAAPEDVRLSFASSSVLAKQIEHGAPANVYVSANTTWVDYLVERGLLAADTRRPLAGNRLVAVVPAASDWPAELAIRGAIARLAPDERVALGDPDHTPAGMYAKAALEHLGLWDAVAGRAARSATVRAALALIETGAAPLGIVYRTDALVSRRVRVVAVFPADSHPPIVYETALVDGAATPAARRFHDCLTGGGGRAVLARHGFSPPPDRAHADAR